MGDIYNSSGSSSSSSSSSGSSLTATSATTLYFKGFVLLKTWTKLTLIDIDCNICFLLLACK